MSKDIESRAIEEAKYFISIPMATVRSTANAMGVSKSTVHKDITKVLKRTELFQLAEKVDLKLKKNKAEKHIRGGESTKRKYKKH